MDRGHGLLSEVVDDMDEDVCAEPDERDQDQRSSEGLSRHGLLLWLRWNAVKANVFSDDSGRHQTQQRSSFQW